MTVLSTNLMQHYLSHSEVQQNFQHFTHAALSQESREAAWGLFNHGVFGGKNVLVAYPRIKQLQKAFLVALPPVVSPQPDGVQSKDESEEHQSELQSLMRSAYA